MDDLSLFDNYCIVCDCAIVAPQEHPPVGKGPVKPAASKKRAQGAIRIKNPDGSTTTRTANGVKTTRPQLRRNASSTKLTSDKLKAEELTPALSSGSDSSSISPAIETPSVDAILPQPTVPQPFISSIYCSLDCHDKDAGSSNATYEDMARVFGAPSVGPGPPSPLLGSDTDSSATNSSIAAAIMLGPARLSATPEALATSVPKTIDFFRVPRDAPDDAWRELELARRLSFGVTRLHPMEPVQPVQQMSRQRSSTGGVSGASSDSLASLWHEDGVHRTNSSGGAMRGMTPMTAESTANRRSMSSSSDGSGISGPVPTRPLARSALSQTSLGGLTSPPLSSFAEVGSAPSHTANAMRSYASAFRGRDGGLASPSHAATSSSNVAIAQIPTRPGSSVRARSRAGSRAGSASWDAFGKAEVQERRRNRLDAGASETDLTVPSSPELDLTRGRLNSAGSIDVTPRQSLEPEHGGWQIRYSTPGSVPTRASRRDKSRSRSRTRHEDGPSPRAASVSTLGRPIPARALPMQTTLSTSNSTARSRTPQSSAMQHSLSFNGGGRSRAQSAALPDLSALRIGSGCAANTWVSHEYASSPPQARSVPRAGFDWDRRSSGHRTYELPKGVVTNPNKGLFYFNA